MQYGLIKSRVDQPLLSQQGHLGNGFADVFCGFHAAPSLATWRLLAVSLADTDGCGSFIGDNRR